MPIAGRPGVSLPTSLRLFRGISTRFLSIPSTANPFRYSSSARVLWSVDSDGADNGGTKGSTFEGVGGTNPEQMPDMVFDSESGP
jgi:hypothetical protein